MFARGKNPSNRKEKTPGAAARLALAASFALSALWLGQPCHASVSPKVQRPAAAKPTELKRQSSPLKTVFDLSHAEIFSPTRPGPLNYSSFYETIRKGGDEIEVNIEPVTPHGLARVKTYIIAGPSQPFSANEIDALKSFVRGGGNLLMLLHISGPIAALSSEFGIVVSNFVIHEPAEKIDKHTQDFFVTRFSSHPVTTGLERVAVYGSWGLMAEGPAKAVATTSQEAFADLSGNRAFDKGEPVQTFGIIAASEFGKGKVVVVADDAPFANRFIGEADNRRLAENILRWFK